MKKNLKRTALTALVSAVWTIQAVAGPLETELRNVLEQLLLRCDGSLIDDKAVALVLQESGLSQIAAPAHPPADSGSDRSADASDLLRPLGEQVLELETRAIEAALQATAGNKLAASKLLGMSRAKLYQRLA